MDFLTVNSKKPIGKTKKETRYRCETTDKVFATKAECQAHCKSNAKPDPKGPASDLKWRRGGDCASETTLEATYRVFRSYKVIIVRSAFQWDPDVHHMPSAQSIVDRWNKTILDHEAGHVEDLKVAARKLLEDEQEYTARGADEFELASDLDGQVEDDNTRIQERFREKMKADATRYHTKMGGSLKLPSICK